MAKEKTSSETLPAGVTANSTNNIARIPSDIQVIATSSFQVLFSGHEISLLAQRILPLTIERDGHLETVLQHTPIASIQMSALAAKDLYLLLDKFVDFYERQFGELVTDYSRTIQTEKK